MRYKRTLTLSTMVWIVETGMLRRRLGHAVLLAAFSLAAAPRSAVMACEGDPQPEEVVARSQEAATPALQQPLSTEGLIPDPQIINVHEHLMGARQLPKYERACEQVGIKSTVFVGSSRFTLYAGAAGFIEHHENNQYLCELARARPGEYLAWVTFHPEQDDMVKLLGEYIASGATGVKLYVGHGEKTGDGEPFHQMELDDPRLCALYDYCQANGVPILIHVNGLKFFDELDRMLAKYPDVPWIIPHFMLLSTKLGELGSMLDKYPRVMIDISFGVLDFEFAGLQRMSRLAAEYEKFFLTYQDRILFGTDAVVTGAAYKTDDYLARCFLAYRQMLELKQFSIDIQGKDVRRNAVLNGLALPPEVVCKIYHENFHEFLKRSSIRNGRIDPAKLTARNGS